MKRIGAMLLLVGAISACTTQKKQEDLSMLGKLYHNTTAKYNGYFNADELLAGSIVQLDDQHHDNYTQLLPMYEYIAADNPQAVAPDLDKAIEKVTVVAQLHRRSHWTDDCYLLLGKAQFLKKDYESAEETLRFMTDEYKPSKEKARKESGAKTKKGSGRTSSRASSGRTGNARPSKKEVAKSKKQQEKERKQYNRELKKKKKKSSSSKGKKPSTPKPGENTETPAATNPVTTPAETPEEAVPTTISLGNSGSEAIESDPDSYFLKHRPAYQEGLLWLAKTYVERDNPDAAMRILGQLERDPKTFKDIGREAAGVMAYSYIQQKKYSEALPYLDKAIDEANRPTKARFSYIKAQLHQKLGQNEAAYQAFEEVLKYTDNYEMEFSAKLSLAQNAWRTGKGTGEEAKQNLEKMLRDPKNAEYKDQIYYALAEIAFEQNNREEGRNDLLLVIENTSGNRALEAEVYYRLAKMAFEDESFVEAKSYFDNTLDRMNSTDERYDEVRRYSTNLTEIAENLTVIIEKDSLLRIAQLSDDEKLALAGKVKKERDDARLKAAQEKAAQQTTAGNKGGAPALVKSDFFAYNDKALKRGIREFQRKWGDRPLKDDWRRSNQNTIADAASPGAETQPEAVPIDPENLSEYLGDFPKTNQEIEEFKIQIREAMFNLGSLYRDRMKNYPKSVDVLEELNSRFPESNYELDSWYLLYLDHTDLNNSARAKEYYDKIVQKYPTTNYAKLLQDPDFAAKFMSEEQQRSRRYDQIYQSFKSGNFQDAYDQGQQAVAQLFGKHPLKAKYALLMAMCTGNLKGKDAYVEDLQKVVALYPDTDEQRKAKEILRMLGGAGAKLPGQAAEEESGYSYNPSELHYIIIVFKQEVNLNDVKFTVSDYNEKYHSLEKLRISNIYMGEKQETPVLVLRRFKNAEESMRYYEGVRKNAKDFLDAGKYKFDVLPVSQNNYRTIITTRNIDAYKEFFERNY